MPDAGLAIPSISVRSAGSPSVVGLYEAKPTTMIPDGFARVCEEMQWDTKSTWLKLADQSLPWFLADNGAYIYRNVADGQWWIDEPGGSGKYVARSEESLPPNSGWKALPGGNHPLPTLEVSGYY